MFKFLPFRALIGTIAAMLLLGGIAHAQPALAQTPTDLIASWLVTVEGEARARVLRVQGVDQKADGSVVLKGSYGFVDGDQGSVGGEVTQSVQGRKLILTTTANSVIVATQSADGIFSGNITYKSGVVKSVKLTRTAESELTLSKRITANAVTSGKAAANHEIVVVYWGSEDCPYCTSWEGSLGAEGKFRASPEFAKLKFYKVKNLWLRGDYYQEHFSPEIAWVWERYQRTRQRPGRPGWQVYMDRKLVASFVGSKAWQEKGLPQIKELVAQNSAQ